MGGGGRRDESRAWRCQEQARPLSSGQQARAAGSGRAQGGREAEHEYCLYRAGGCGRPESRARLSVGPGGWSPHESELPDGPWSRNEQNRAPNELQAANPQTGFSTAAQGKSALPSLTQQTAPPSAPPHRPGPTRMSPVGTGPPSEPGEDTGASRDCLLWQITCPLRQPPGWPHLPSTPAGVPWGAPLACQRCGGMEGDGR